MKFFVDIAKYMPSFKSYKKSSGAVTGTSSFHKPPVRVSAFISCAKIAVVFLLLVSLAAGIFPIVFSAAADEEISILFTHDMHSHFDPERYMNGGKVEERGGFSRMKTVIDRTLERFPESFLLDAGDFAMGTLYQTIYSEEASELRLMGRLGYDAATLGNHEFDYRTQGLTDMLNTALASGDKLPPITISNIDWERTLADEERAEKAKALKTAMESYGVSDYKIIEKGNIKAAVFGIMGKEADSYAPESGLYFKDQIETAKAVVAQIKDKTDADIIICLSHSGTNPNPKKSEDEQLAAAVPDIDVIVSGHTHTKLEEPIAVGDTLIVSSGEYAYNIGHLKLIRSGDRFKVESYDVIPISQDLQKNAEIEKAINVFLKLVNTHYLSRFGYSYSDVLAYSPFEFTPIETLGNDPGEDTLGNLIADSYINAVKKAEGDDYQTVDVAVVPYGVIRGSFTEGKITTADAFAVSSLGIGADKIPGYPLVSIHLTGKELKALAEIDISVSTLMIEARLYTSGLSYTYNPNRLLLNRVTETRLVDPDGNDLKLEDKNLYRVIGGLYSCQMLGAVESKSFGLLKVTPKDQSGKPIVSFEDHIVYDNNVELKEWIALAQYLESFESENGVHRVPDYYNQLHGRKVEENSRSIFALLKKPNKIFFLLLGVILLVLAIIIVPICLIVRKRRLKKRNIS